MVAGMSWQEAVATGVAFVFLYCFFVVLLTIIVDVFENTRKKK